jgi:hypothetical protein
MNACSYYTRMFPQLARPTSTPNSELEKGLEKLGRLMTDDGEEERHTIPAGYTYLGQFIDHDLTLDLTPLDRAQPNGDRTRNFRNPFLDLDHLYGGGPSLSPFLYRNDYKDRGKERFLIGHTIRPDGKKGPDDDLPRNPEGIALVGDPRQDENLIIAQLHVAFLKFHNRVMDELEKGAKGEVQSAGPARATLFEQARRLVTWHYQYIVLHDFLAALIDPTVYKDLERKPASAATGESGRFCIPIEFSVAAFRFGHSMVRDSYEYNKAHHRDDATLDKLLKLTGAGGGAVPALPADWIIEWYRFFYLGRPTHNAAREIDTKIAMGLHNLPSAAVKLFSAPQPSEPPKNELPLPVRTLWRGARAGLPSGQDVAKALCIQVLTDKEIAKGPHEDILIKYGFHKDTPLWYYILKEAELLGKGRRLGPVGSRIVARVIVGALKADPDSHLSVYPNWTPMLAGKPAETMGQLLPFIRRPEDR